MDAADRRRPLCVRIVSPYGAVRRAGLRALLADVPGVTPSEEPGGLSDALDDHGSGTVLVLDHGGDTEPDALADALGRLEDAAAVGLVVVGGDPEADLPTLLARGPTPFGWAYLAPDTIDTETLTAAVRAAAAGLVALDPAAVSRLSLPAAEEDVEAGDDEESPAPADATLTAREGEVLRLMALGLPNKTIASRLGISLHTAKFHVAQILAKLGATSRTEAVTLGARRGLITL